MLNKLWNRPNFIIIISVTLAPGSCFADHFGPRDIAARRGVRAPGDAVCGLPGDGAALGAQEGLSGGLIRVGARELKDSTPSLCTLICQVFALLFVLRSSLSMSST